MRNPVQLPEVVVVSFNFPSLYALVTILRQPSSPHGTPKELRTIQYSVPFSTPQQSTGNNVVDHR